MCAALVNARTNYGDMRWVWLEKGKHFDTEFWEQKGPLRSPEPLLSVKQCSGPFPSPCPPKSGLPGPQERVLVLRSLQSRGVRRSWSESIQAPLLLAAAGG